MKQVNINNYQAIAVSIVLVVSCLIVIFLTINFNGSTLGLYCESNFWENILVEAHGMLLDLFLVGFVLLIVLNRIVLNSKIDELTDVINFNRYLKSDESKYRIKTAIELLNKRKKTKLDLHQCNLSRIVFSKFDLTGGTIHAVDFTSSNIKMAKLDKTDCTRGIFTEAKMNSVTFKKSKIYRANMNKMIARSISFVKSSIIKTDFTNSDLNNADFRYCNLDKIKFDNAILKNADFRECDFRSQISFTGADLQSADFTNAKGVSPIDLIKAKSLSKIKVDKELQKELESLNASL